MSELLREHPDGVTLTVRAKPGSKRVRVTVETGRLVIAVQAPAVEGKANVALLEALAVALGVRPRQLTLLSGDTSRDKVVLVTGLARDEVRDRLQHLTEVDR